MEQTANTAGDFAQTTDDLANAQRVAAARAENAAAKFGRAGTPVFADIVGFAGDVLLSFQALGGSETAQMELRVSEAITNIQRAADNGADPLTALADGMLHVAENGELTAGVFRALAAQAGLMPDQFDEFSEVVLAQAEANGINADSLDEMRRAMETNTDATEDGTSAGHDFAAAEEAQRAAVDAAREAIEKKQQKLREIHHATHPGARLGRPENPDQEGEEPSGAVLRSEDQEP